MAPGSGTGKDQVGQHWPGHCQEQPHSSWMAPDGEPLPGDRGRVLILVATAVFVWLVVRLVREVRTDGYGGRPPPRSHPEEELWQR